MDLELNMCLVMEDDALHLSELREGRSGAAEKRTLEKALAILEDIRDADSNVSAIAKQDFRYVMGQIAAIRFVLGMPDAARQYLSAEDGMEE